MIRNSNKKTALLTGANGGIGRAISEKLNKNQFSVIQTDKTQAINSEFPFFACDIQDSIQIDALYDWLISEHELPEILILNAGVGVKERLFEGDPEKWQEVVNVNIMGALRCIRAFVPKMLERKTGHVIFISSVAAFQPHPYGGIYAATKSALEVLAETLRLETLSYIKVTTICPGATKTDFFINQLGGFSGATEVPMLKPEAIALDVLYALSASDRVINKIVTRPMGQEF